MKRLFLSFLFLSGTFGYAQTNVNMSANGNTSSCSGYFYDDKGPSTNYSDNLNYVHNFYAGGGKFFSFTVEAFNLSPGDTLKFYNGPNATGGLIANLVGNIPPTSVFKSQNDTVSFRFTSDAGVNSTGWQMQYQCLNPSISYATPVSIIAGTNQNITVKGINTSFLLNLPSKQFKLIRGNDTIVGTSITTFSNDSLRVNFATNCSVSTGFYNLISSGFGQGIVSLGNAVNIDKISVSIDSTDVLCFGNCNGTASSTVQFGTAPFSYLWSPGALTSQNITGLCKGDYTLQVTDSKGCVAIDSITINEPGYFSVTANSITICEGQMQNVQATASGGTAPYTYNWSPGTGLSSTTVENPMANPAVTTTYTVSVDDANLCPTQTTTLTVTVNPLPTVDTVTAQLKWCDGQITNQINFSSSIAGTNFEWANNNLSVGLSSSGSGNLPSYFATNNGASNEIATISVTPVANGCSGNAYNFDMTISPTTSITSSTLSGQTVCLNSPFSQISVTASGDSLTYQWYSNTSQSTTGGTFIAGATASDYTPSSSSVGTKYYYCVVNGRCGISTSSASGAFIVNGSTQINSQTTNAQTVCQNGAFSPISVSASGQNLIYQWYSNTVTNNFGGTLISGATASSFTPPTSISGSKYYYVIVNGDCGGDTSAISGIIKVNPSTVINSQVTSGQTTCINTAFTPIYFNANGQNISYQWYKNSVSSTAGGVLISGATDTTYTPDATNPGATYYYFIVSGNCGTVTSNVSGAFLVNNLNTSGAASSTPTLCVNTSLTTITHATTGATGIGTATGLPAGVTASWLSNTISISGTPSASGTFNYTIPLTGGCGTVNATGTIVVTPLKTAGAPSSTPTLCVNTPLTTITHATTGATGIGTATGLPAGVTASWLSNTISISGTPSASGTFNYTIPLTGGCGTVNATGTITVGAATTITAQSTSAQTVCQSVTFNPITVTASGTSLSYQWYSNSSSSNVGGTLINGATNSTYTALSSSPGTSYYYVVVTGTCSSDTSNVSGAFLVNATPTIISTLGDSICGSGPATLTATPSSGTIDWFATLTGGSPITTGVTYTTPVLSANTTYYAQAVSAGCVSSPRTAVVAEVVPIPTILTTTGDSICDGGSGMLSATANFGTINWYANSTGGTSLHAGPNFTSPFVSVTTTFYVDAENNTCSSSPRIPVQVVVSLSPTITGTTPDSICNSGTATLLASANTGSINWYDNVTGGTLLFTGGSFTTPSLTSTTPYYVEASSVGCSSPRVLVEAVVNTSPFITSVTGAGVCISGSDTLFATSGSGVINWYTVPSGGSPIASGNFYVTPVVSSTTSYYVEAIENGCISLSRDPVTLVVSNGDTISSQSTSGQTVCLNGVFTPISITTSAPPVSYQWYSNVSAANTGGTILPGATNFDYTPTSTVVGTKYYYCEIVGGCGNIVSSVSGAFVVNPLPLDTIVFGSNPTCEGSQNYLQSSQSGAVSYSWSGPNGFSSTQTLPFINNVSSASAGVYSLTVVGANGCSASDTASLAVLLKPLVNAGADQTVCSGSLISLTATGALNYNWSGGIVNGSSFTAVSSATYTVTGTGGNGCSNSDTVSVIVNQTPTSSVSANRLEFCEADSLFLTSSTTGNSVSWVGPNNFTSNVSNPIIAPLSSLSTGTYTLFSTGANGCIDSSAFIDINVSIFPSVNVIVNTDTICPGGFVSANASYSFADSLVWNPGGFNSANAYLSPSASTTYTFTAYNTLGGCSTSITQTIDVVSVPLISFNSTNVSCFGFSDGVVNTVVNGFSQNIMYAWSNGAQSASLTGLTAGTYSLTIMDENFCTASDSITITEPLEINISLSATNVNCGQSNGILTSSVINGTPPYNYYWSNGDRTSIADSLLPGGYKLELVDANGCQGTAIESIVALNGPVVTVSQISNVSCAGGSDGSIDVQITGGLPPMNLLWSTGATTNLIGGLSAGVYDLQVYDASGCITNSAINILEPAEITITDSLIFPTCGMADGGVILSVNGGFGPNYSFQWSANAGSAQSSSVSNLSAGLYTVTVSDNNFCSTSKVIALKNPNTDIGIVLDSVINSNCTAVPQGGLYVTTAGAAAPLSYLWSNGSTSEDLVNTNPGLYILMATDTNLCVNSDEFALPSKLAGYRPEICLVTVDDTINRNVVVWNKEYDRGIAAYRIYRQTSLQNFYLRVGTVPFDSLSIFKDSIASADIRSWRYKITAIDSCGYETPKSDFQKTIHLVIKPDTANNKVNLFWDYYDGLPFSKYYILREDIAGYSVIDSVNSNVLSYTDANPPSIGVGYRIDAVVSQACDPALRLNENGETVLTAVVKTRSNVKNNRTSGIIKYTKEVSWKVYPVPANDKLYIELENHVEQVDVELVNLMGQVVHQQLIERHETKLSLDVSGFNPGVYLVRLKSTKGILAQKVVIEK